MMVVRIVNGNTFEVRYLTEAEAEYAAWVHERTHGRDCPCGFAVLGPVFVAEGGREDRNQERQRR